MPSVTLRQFHQALVNMLHCPPHDSLIRDHAVSLEVFIQKHISVTGDLESRNSAEPNIASDVCEQNIFHDSCTDKSISSCIEKYCMNGHEASKQFTVDGRREPNGPIGSGNDINCESSGEEIACTEMDVDPSSICVSPPGLYSVDEAVSSSIFSENNERVPISTKTVHIPPGVDLHIEQNSFENDVSNKGCQESAMDIERQSIDIPASSIEFVG